MEAPFASSTQSNADAPNTGAPYGQTTWKTRILVIGVVVALICALALIADTCLGVYDAYRLKKHGRVVFGTVFGRDGNVHTVKYLGQVKKIRFGNTYSSGSRAPVLCVPSNPDVALDADPHATFGELLTLRFGGKTAITWRLAGIVTIISSLSVAVGRLHRRKTYSSPLKAGLTRRPAPKAPQIRLSLPAVIRGLWVCMAVTSIGSLIGFTAFGPPRTLGPWWKAPWWDPANLVALISLYVMFGWCLIPLPFAALTALTACARWFTARPNLSRGAGWRLLRAVSFWTLPLLIAVMALLYLGFRHRLGQGIRYMH